jgi:hypothetical protein
VVNCINISLAVLADTKKAKIGGYLLRGFEKTYKKTRTWRVFVFDTYHIFLLKKIQDFVFYGLS